MILLLAGVLGAFWGVIWALALNTAPGRYIARRQTWLAVVVGIGGDLLIMALVLSLTDWLSVCGIVAASSVGIILRSLLHQWREHSELLEAARGVNDPPRQ